MRTILLRSLYLFLRALRPRANRQPERRVLLVLHYQMPLGCCVHATPLFAAIKAAEPACTLVVATRGLAAQTFRHDPNIDVLLETGDPRATRYALFAVVRELRNQLHQRKLRPTLILQPATDRAGSFALFAQALRLAPTAGFAQAPALYDTHLAYDPHRSLIDNNLRLAELAGATTAHIEPAVYCTARELTKAQQLLAEAGAEGSHVCAFVVQGSGGQRTGWQDDRFAAVIRHVEALGLATIFLGTASDAPQIEHILSMAGSKGQSLAGKTTVPELAAVLANCDLLVSIDTGTMHVGRAAGLPMVVLGPSWQHPLEWLPLGLANARVLRGEDRTSVPPGYRLDEIEVPAVLAAIDELLALYPPSAQDRARRTQRLLSTTRE